jgi:hypothetical protein
VKKLLLFVLLCSCFSLFAYGQDQAGESTVDSGEAAGGVEDTASERRSSRAAFFSGEGAALSTGKRESRRYFELEIADFSLGLNGIGLGKFLDGSFLDFGDLNVDGMPGFKGGVRLFANPVKFRVSIGNTFNLDFFTGAQTDIFVNLPKKTTDSLSRLMEISNEKPPGYNGGTPTSGEESKYENELDNYINSLTGVDATMSAGAGAFIELGMGGSKTLLNDRLWVRVAPSLFFTLLYMKNDEVRLTGYENKQNKKYGLRGEGEMTLYSAWDLSEEVNPFASPGVDLTLEACYALWSVLDAGISVSHIPIVPSTLRHSKSLDMSKITMTVDGDLKKVAQNPNKTVDFNVPELDSIFEDGQDDNKKVTRPVRFDFYTLYKPFKSPILVIRPNVGATLNTLAGTSMFNWGVNIQFNAPLIFSAFIGTGLTEGTWSNRAGIGLDFRAFEFDIGAGLAAPTFAESFSIKRGFEVAIGFKAGF